MNINAGDEIEFTTEPIPGMGKIFIYKGSFEINGNILHVIQKGVFEYNITEKQLRDNF